MVVKEHRCSRHYKEMYGVSPLKNYKKTCSAEGCDTPIVKEGLCHRHLTKRDGHSPYPKSKKARQPSEGTVRQVVSQTVPDNGNRTVALNFTFSNGKLVFDGCAIDARTYADINGSFDDWMFLGAIASEIRRIAGV